MATSYSTILKKFDDNLSDSDSSSVELMTKRQYLRNAISSYIATIGKITPNNQTQLIAEDLNEVEMLLLSLLMYDSYLLQEVIRYNKVINISNEFITISGASMRVKTLKDLKDANQATINNILTNMY